MEAVTALHTAVYNYRHQQLALVFTQQDTEALCNNTSARVPMGMVRSPDLLQQGGRHSLHTTREQQK
jgi:hypothetical protein